MKDKIRLTNFGVIYLFPKNLIGFSISPNGLVTVLFGGKEYHVEQSIQEILKELGEL